jgi:hypothetical protein
VYFGASYHADYATLLAHPRDMPRAADALVGELGPEHRRALENTEHDLAARRPR